MSALFRFDWDPEKARENVRKHGVSFEQATQVFRDPLALTIFDEDHGGEAEERWITVGAGERALLIVVHTFREPSADEIAVRIISARLATTHETRQYEEGT